MNKRTIQIEKYGKFEVYGHSPWYLLPVTKDQVGVDGLMMTDAPLDMASKTPLKFNSLIRVTDKGVKMPVVFSGPTGQEIAEEILFILNSKL